MTPTPAIVLERVREWGRVGLALHSACAAYEAILVASVGTDPKGGDNSLAPFIGDAVPKADAQNTPQVSDNEL